MKKSLSLLLALCMIFALVACGSSSSDSEEVVSANGSESAEETEESEEVSILNLVGEWTQMDADEDSWMQAVIIEDTIMVYFMDSEGSIATYWAGTFVAPTTSDNSYSWKSENDHDITDYTLLGATADTKEFTYKNGVLSFSGSIMDTDFSVDMEKISDDTPTYSDNLFDFDDVTENVDTAALAENIEYTVEMTTNGALVSITNNNDSLIESASLDFIYYDESGEMTAQDSLYIETLPANDTREYTLYNWGDVYVDYETQLSVYNYWYGEDDCTEWLDLEYNDTGEGVVIKGTNNGDAEISSVQLCIAYYSDGELVAVDVGYLDNIPVDGFDSTSSYTPYDPFTYDDIAYNSCTVSISYAYYYPE